MITHCYICGKQGTPEEMYTMYYQATVADKKRPRIRIYLEEAFLCSKECDLQLQDNVEALASHPARGDIEILRDWLDRYKNEGADAPLPFSMIEDEYPQHLTYFAELLDEATVEHCKRYLTEHPDHRARAWSVIDHRWLEPWEVYMDDHQGYHDEWPPIIEVAIELLS